jgi:hypothetical protein
MLKAGSVAHAEDIMLLGRVVPVALATIVLGISASPPAETPFRAASTVAAAAGPGDLIAVSTRGDAKNESTDPMRQKFTFPLYSLVDGSLVGNATDDVACSSSTPPPCAVIDAITTFRFTQGMFPLGTIVNHAQVSIAPDAQRPGFILVGSRPSGPTIVSATGAYAGRSGGVRLSGGNNVRNFPNELIQDDFWVIEVQ